jgi:autotransporter-associated beta strand protein
MRIGLSLAILAAWPALAGAAEDMTLNGGQAYTGPTGVLQGTLLLNGSLPGSVSCIRPARFGPPARLAAA